MLDRRPDDPIGYTYKADVYCDVCVLAVMKRQTDARWGEFIPARDNSRAVWELLQDVCWAVPGMDIMDETTWDEDDFPKPIWPWQVLQEHCALCREPLVEGETDKGRWLP